MSFTASLPTTTRKKWNIIPFSIQLQDLLFYVAVQISLLSVPEVEEERKISCPPTTYGRLSTHRQMLFFNYGLRSYAHKEMDRLTTNLINYTSPK